MPDNKKILIIDDDEEMCEELKALLQDEGHSVEVVYNGAVGMEAINKKYYKVIVLDLKMPGLNGREVLEFVKSRYKDIRILILTGTPLSNKLLGIGNGKDIEAEKFPYENHYKYTVLKMADAIVNKPFEIENVLSRIKQLARDKGDEKLKPGSRLSPG